MNKCFKITVLFLLAIQLNSCLEIPSFGKDKKLSLTEDFNTVEVKDYSIAIPKYMKVATELNDEASLQYQNIFKNSYIVILDEPKEDLKSAFEDIGEWDEANSYAENYKDFQMQALGEAIEITNKSPSKNVTLNGLDAHIVEMDGKVEGVIYEIAYTLAFIEGDKNMYMAMLWCLKDGRKKYENTYEQMLNSFKLVE